MREGGRYFYLHNDGKQDQAVLMVSADAAEFASGPGRELIDPNGLRGDATVSLADYVPSPDGRWLAYSISDAGSDWNTWHVMDVETGKDQPEVLRDTKFTRASWARDGSGSTTAPIPAAMTSCRPWCAGTAWVIRSRRIAKCSRCAIIPRACPMAKSPRMAVTW